MMNEIVIVIFLYVLIRYKNIIFFVYSHLFLKKTLFPSAFFLFLGAESVC